MDIAKGIGIILVFLGHFNIPDTLRAEIYTFHIPLFFFLFLLMIQLLCLVFGLAGHVYSQLAECAAVHAGKYDR